MTARERVTRAIEFRTPDRLPIAGNCMEYSPQGDVVYHFPKMKGQAYWRGGGGVDEWGCRWETNRDGDMGQVREHALANDIRAFSGLPRPDGNDPDRYLDLAQELPERPDAYHVFCNGCALFERMHFLRGFDTLLMDLATDPAGFTAFAAWVVHYQEETVRYLARHFKGKVQALRCTDDLGSQATSIMSPEMFRDLMKPHYARLARLCHDNGLHFWLHSCGRIDGLLDDLIDAGVDVINMMQPRLFDLPDLGRRFAGRITFENYVDLQRTLPTGNRNLIRADIDEQLRCLATPQGGYIAMWLDPYYLKSECNLDDPAFSAFITETYRAFDPFANRISGDGVRPSPQPPGE